MSSLSPSVRQTGILENQSQYRFQQKRKKPRVGRGGQLINSNWVMPVKCSSEKGTHSKEGGGLVGGRAWALGSDNPSSILLHHHHGAPSPCPPPAASCVQYPLTYQGTHVASVIFISAWGRCSLVVGTLKWPQNFIPFA